MGLREDRTFLKERKAAKEAIAENARQQEIADYNKALNDREDLKLAHEAMVDKFYEYKSNVKKMLVTEALITLYRNCLNNPSNEEIAIGEALVGQYVEDLGVSTVLKNMKFSENGLLVSIAEKVDETYKDITSGTSADDVDSQTIRPEDIDKFWNDIEKMDDVDDITSTIRLRVSNAEENFVNKNQIDKANVEDVLKNTAARVQAAKTSNDNDYSDAVEESETRLAKQQIYKIQHENRTNVFDRMVRNLSEAVIKNRDAGKEFSYRNGRLNMEKIVESARCMYTLLEMVSTLGIEKVDQQYIEDTLKSIK